MTPHQVDVEALKEGATKKDDNLVPFARAINPLKPQVLPLLFLFITLEPRVE